MFKKTTAKIRNDTLQNWAIQLKLLQSSLKECSEHVRTLKQKIKEYDAARDVNRRSAARGAVKVQLAMAKKAAQSVSSTSQDNLLGINDSKIEEMMPKETE